MGCQWPLQAPRDLGREEAAAGSLLARYTEPSLRISGSLCFTEAPFTRPGQCNQLLQSFAPPAMMALDDLMSEFAVCQ